ncbi:uncharacterized protein LOC117169877 [Belonocnema kinseyi]|uniref:uncharacterized protein LOC117169877 n=1 Tax=Belonocnema kinseyi TaxID=2817044 RepID=UPI00143E02A7|nr:uncharacterized protein LOC117169877 [Belonocnema kinseyi]
MRAAQGRTSQDIANALAMDQTTWLFVSPSAPYFGGLRGAAVNSTKHHFKRVNGTSTLTFEEISKVLSHMEECLKSRPLQAITDDPSDLFALTPGHFLIGGPLTVVPEPSLIQEYGPANERWKMFQKMPLHAVRIATTELERTILKLCLLPPVKEDLE